MVSLCPRKLTGYHGIENHADTPTIACSSVIGSAADAFGACVARAAAWGSGETVLIEEAAESEVADFCVSVLIEEEVFWFEIAVADAHHVDVTDGFEDLDHDWFGSIFR